MTTTYLNALILPKVLPLEPKTPPPPKKKTQQTKQGPLRRQNSSPYHNNLQYQQPAIFMKIKDQNNNYYEGYTLNQKANGTGKKFYNDYDFTIFTKFKDNQPIEQARAQIKYANNDMYIGQIHINENNIPVAQDLNGILNYTDGRRFEGEFRNGKPVSGIIYYPNGDKYEGNVNSKGQEYGKGKKYFTNPKYSVEGTFYKGRPLAINNKPSNIPLEKYPQIILFPNNRRYKGPIGLNDINFPEAHGPNGTMLFSDGSSFSGEVYKVQNCSKPEYKFALKKIPNADSNDFREYTIPAKMGHPNIIEVYDIAQEKAPQKGPNLYIRMELAQESLESKITKEKQLSLKDFNKLKNDLINGVKYMHSMGCVHFDLKPANIMIDAEGTNKIGDFGSARKIFNKLTLKSIGLTPFYAAPEILRRAGSDTIISIEEAKQGDLFSLGVILLEAKGISLENYVANVCDACGITKAKYQKALYNLCLENNKDPDLPLLADLLDPNPVTRGTRIYQHLNPENLN